VVAEHLSKALALGPPQVMEAFIGADGATTSNVRLLQGKPDQWIEQ